MSGEDQMALAERMMQRALAAGAEAADVLVHSAVSSAVGVAGRALEEAERAEGRDLGLRVLIGRRQACVSSSDDSNRTLDEMAERAVAMARAAPEDPWCGLADPEQLGASPDVDVLELSDPGDFPDPAALEDTALALEDAALAVPGVTQVEQASASWSRERITILQSNGFQGGYARTSIGLGASAIAGTGLGRERDYSYQTRRFAADLPPADEIGREAGERAAARLGARKPPAGRFPVLYDERVSASLIAHVLSAINGTAVARGASWLSAAMETAILPTGFEIADDPLIPRGRATRPFDAEGLPARRRLLVEDGTLRSWILDLSTARKLGLRSTGHARRGAGGPPSPGPSNIRVTQGPDSREALIGQMGRGLLITSLIGSSVSPTTGAYSRGAGGFWIEDGRIAYPVNEVTVAGSLPAMVRTLRPANDADPHRALSAPSLLVEGMTIGA